MTETWRGIRGFPGYQISSRARVRRISSGRILKPWLIDGLYEIIGLFKHGKCFKKSVARLRAIAFDGLRKDQRIDHRRGIGVSQAEIIRSARGRIPHSSKYKGVSKRGGHWHSYIHINGRSRLLGVFRTERQAGLAYDRAARKAWGAGKCFENFPASYRNSMMNH